MPTPPTPTVRPAPRPGALALFLAFTQIRLTSFGGGLSGRMLRDFVHTRRWLDEEALLNGLALSQALPGVNVKNLAIWIGYRLCGWRGAVRRDDAHLRVDCRAALAAGVDGTDRRRRERRARIPARGARIGRSDR